MTEITTEGAEGAEATGKEMDPERLNGISGSIIGAVGIPTKHKRR
jgi:hypothetical protein